MTKTVTAILMGDPASRRARPPTEKEKATSFAPKHCEPFKRVHAKGPKKREGMSPEEMALSEAYGLYRAEAACLWVLYQHPAGLTGDVLAQKSKVGRLSISACLGRIRKSLQVTYKGDVYVLPKESSEAVQALLSSLEKAA